LGHHFENESLLSLQELGKHFLVEHIGRSPARFDLGQLNHWQKEVVLTKNEQQLTEWLAPYLKAAVKPEQIASFIDVIKQNIILPADALFWAQQLLSDHPTFSEEAQQALDEGGIEFLNHLEQAITLEGENYKAVTTYLIQQTGLKGKALFLPLRSAITGVCHGPELAKIFLLMGKEGLTQQINNARNAMMRSI
jgi:glutamyl-tRNA synthetase